MLRQTKAQTRECDAIEARPRYALFDGKPLRHTLGYRIGTAIAEIRILLVTSFSPDDAEIRDFFSNVLKLLGFAVREVGGASLSSPSDEVREAIDASPVVAMVVTDGNGSADPVWANLDGGPAFRKNKVVVAMVEDTVKSVGPYRSTLGSSLLVFNRHRPFECLDELKRLSVEIRERLAKPEPGIRVAGLRPDFDNPGFNLLYVTKEVWVRPTGFAVISFGVEMEAIVERRDSLVLRIGLNDFVPEHVAIPPLVVMMQRRRDIWREPAFRIHLLSRHPGGFKFNLEEVRFGDAPYTPREIEGRVRYLKVSFSRPLHLHERLTYAWAWSFDHLYLPCGRHGRDGSHYTPDHPVDSLEYRLHLPGGDEGRPFRRPPQLVIVNPYGASIDNNLTALTEDALFFNYCWVASSVVAGSKCKIEWEFV